MDFDEEYRLLSYQQVKSREDAKFDHHQMIKAEKDQETSDEEEKMSEKRFSSYSKPREGKSKIKIKGASVSAQGQCSGSASVRVCDFCGKKFNSGKALGGHRRYHIQAQRKMKQQEEKASYTLRIKTKNLVIHDDNSNLDSSSWRRFCCLVCGKYFPSKKSLSGHMISHPEREWRGKNPIFVTIDNALQELMTLQDNGSSSSTSEESLSVPIDVSSSCPESSLKKDMRGRKTIGEAEAAHIAARTLLRMHLSGNFHRRDRLPPEDEHAPKAAALLPVKKRKKVMKKHVAGSSSSPAGKEKEKLEGSHGNEELEADMKVISIIKEKKKMKLGPEMIKSEGEPLMIRTVKEEVTPAQSYVCDVCNKSFTCFQALGGHKTKHRKNIVKSTKGKEVVEQRQVEEKIFRNGTLRGEEADLISSEETLLISSNDNEDNNNEEQVGAARQQSASKIRDFDLNLPYVLED